MAPLKTRTSTHSARVTIYENSSATCPSEPAASISTAPAVASSRRTTRASAAAYVGPPEFGLSLPKAEEDSEDVKPVKKARSPRKPKPHVERLAVPHPAPKRWEETYEVIRKQRERIIAPVDTMGCEQGGKESKGEDEKDRRLSVIVSLMLSSQTKDPVTHQATMNLRNQLPGGLTLEGLETATVEEIDAAICKVGFHNTKAKYLKLLATRLRNLHDGDVPDDLPSLLAINGVGPKMAYLYLQAIGENAGIGVDTHVHRITNRLRWHKKETTMPEQTRLNLESWLPRHLWPTVNKMLVGFGQEICKPVAPRCDLCDVATAKLCPSRRVVVASPIKKRVKAEVEEEMADGQPQIDLALEQAEEVIGQVVVAVKQEELGSLQVEERVVKAENAV
ncbi:endonuclease III [Rhodotorula toruloides]|uniref:Endonuclease III homolog n=1 Tax=Rhodotorula toruloides TaxID=5286 RepID=A0A511KGH9_RHOTO|nr:endonuclease III [Rhodotorula toruloides]